MKGKHKLKTDTCRCNSELSGSQEYGVLPLLAMIPWWAWTALAGTAIVGAGAAVYAFKDKTPQEIYLDCLEAGMKRGLSTSEASRQCAKVEPPTPAPLGMPSWAWGALIVSGSLIVAKKMIFDSPRRQEAI